MLENQDKYDGDFSAQEYENLRHKIIEEFVTRAEVKEIIDFVIDVLRSSGAPEDTSKKTLTEIRQELLEIASHRIERRD